jgi:hypothetical protein
MEVSSALLVIQLAVSYNLIPIANKVISLIGLTSLLVNQLSSFPLYRWKDQVKICVLRGKTSFITSPTNCDVKIVRKENN